MAEDKTKEEEELESGAKETTGAEETKGGADRSTGADTGANKDGKGGEGAGDNGAKDKTFTQDQVNKMMTREKNQGRSAALKELGIDPKDTKAVAMVKALLESQKTEEQKAAEQAAGDVAKQAEAERRVAIAEAKAEAMVIGVQSQYVDDVVALAMSKMSDDTDLKTIIGEYKAKYPMWFGGTGEDDDKKGGTKKTGQKGTGSSVKGNAGGGDGEAKGLGARLAAQRKSSVGKSSYWGKH